MSKEKGGQILEAVVGQITGPVDLYDPSSTIHFITKEATDGRIVLIGSTVFMVGKVNL